MVRFGGCFVVFYLAFFVLDFVVGNSTSTDPVSTFETHLRDSNYNRHLRPRDDQASPTDVKVSIHVVQSWGICQEKSIWKAELYLKQRWLDKRLVFSDKMGDVTLLPADKRLDALIWTPNTYIPEATVESQPPQGDYITVVDDGSVVKTTRIVGEFPCVFNQTTNPNHVAICSLKITDFGRSSEDVSYNWDNGSNSVSSKPEVLSRGAYNFSGQILKFSQHSSQRPSVLVAEMFFQRKVGKECRLILLPALICVCVAILALYVPIEKVTCRFLLSVVSMFGGTAISMYYVGRLSSGSPVTSVENFLYGCLAAIALTLIDHLLASFRYVYREKEEVTFVEARDTRSYLSQQQYRVLQKHPDHQRLLQCTPEPKQSRWQRCVSCSRRCTLVFVAVVDWLLRIGVPVAFAVLVYLFCQHWCQNKSVETRGLEPPVYRLDSTVTPIVL